MFSNSFMSPRRLSGIALTFLLLAACLCAEARAQTAPAAIASFATVLNQPANTSFGSIANTAADTFGDWLVVDDTNGALYELPAGSGTFMTLVPAGGLAGSGTASSIATPGIAIDPKNNLYIEGGTCVLMYPYDTKTGTWDGLTALTQSAPSSGACGAAAPSFYNLGTGVQIWGIGIGNTSTPSLLVGTSSSSANGIASIAVTGAWTAPVAGTVTQIITGLQGTAISIAEDPAGNIYFVEQGKGALVGVYEIPAGKTGLTSDSGLKRIDPNLPSATGVTIDGIGNIYISDSTDGVFLIPSGSSSSSAALLLTSVPAQGTVGLTGNDGYLFVPSAQKGSTEVDEVAFNTAAFGAETVGTSKPLQESVIFSFNASATPGTIEILEAGTSNPDFSIVSGGSLACATGTLYASETPCTVAVSFTPHAAGAVSATLAVLDAKGNLLGSIALGGIGTSAAVQFMEPKQSKIGGSLKTPSQIAVDAAGNLYVADAGLGAVEMYPAGSAAGAAGIPVGTGIKAPTGVAVDGAGDVFIADSGSIYEVPETAGGLNSKGQVTLKTGLSLGSDVLLAADGLGNLFVSDVSNQKVYELENFSTGWNTSLPGVLSSQIVTLAGAAVSAPSAIAVDSNDNLYVVNGANLYEVTPTGTQTQVLSGLAGITGLAIDPSGSAYVAMTGGTIRVPFGSGSLNIADKAAVASGVTSPASVVLDSLGNIYVADGSALNVNETTASASIKFGTLTADPYPAPSAGSSTTQTATLMNYGNAALVVTGYANTADFSETADTCSGNSIAINSTCTVTITFSAGIGDGGTLTGEVLVQGNVANTPVGVNGSGVAPTLAGTTTAMTVATNGTIEGVPVTVTVAPNPANSQPLTGTVTLAVIPGSNVPVTGPALPNPYAITLPLTNGAVQFNPTMLPIGKYTFTAIYNGDPAYIYEHSSNPQSVSISTAVAVVMTQPALSSLPFPSYTLPCTSGSGSSCTTTYNYGQPSGNPPGYLILGGNCLYCGGQEPYDGSDNQWEYTYPVSVAPAAAGFPMVGLAVYNTATPPVETGFNYGSVNYKEANGHSLCGDNADSVSIVNVSSTGDATFPLPAFGCALINTTNNTIPDILTYYTVTPEYTGTYNNLVDNNQNYTQTTGSSIGIWSLRNPVVQISSSPASLTVAPGSSVSATLTLTSLLGYGYAGRNALENNWSLPLDLDCQGLPAYATCSFTYPAPNPADPNVVPNPVNGSINIAALQCASSTAAAPVYCAIDVGPAPGSAYRYNYFGQPTLPSSPTAAAYPCGPMDGCLGPGKVVVTINTNAGSGTTASRNADKSSFALSALFGLGFLGFAFRKRASRWGSLLMVVCLLLCGGAIAGITACGTTTLGVGSGSVVTPSGSYWVTITAKETGSLQVQLPAPPANPALATTVLQTVYGSGNLASLPFAINVTVQ